MATSATINNAIRPMRSVTGTYRGRLTLVPHLGGNAHEQNGTPQHENREKSMWRARNRAVVCSAVSSYANKMVETLQPRRFGAGQQSVKPANSSRRLLAAFDFATANHF